MTVSITATDVVRIERNPLPDLGAQLRMDGDIFVYISPETAEQWIPILTAIANEKSTNA